jgi:hypothetical protein
MRNRKKTWLIGAVATLALAQGTHALDLGKVPASDWIQMFNKKDLDGWVKKVSGTTVGQDPYDTWYVKDSLLWVDYKNYTGPFAERFGHLGYQKRKFSYYLIRAVYQFWGNQATGAPEWAYQNNGLMYHSQSMETMGLKQSFPDCVEFQLLGEHNKQNKDGTTGNVCGVGATFIIDGKRDEYWCKTANPHNIIGLPWVTVEGLILGDSISRHIVEGDTVLTYTQLLAKKDNKPLKEGYIAIQAESTPTKFKTIEILDLEGCTDPKFANYRSYYVKSKPSSCAGTVSARLRPLPAGLALESVRGQVTLKLPATGAWRAELADLSGHARMGASIASGGGLRIPTASLRPGLYFLSVTDGSGWFQGKITVLEAGLPPAARSLGIPPQRRPIGPFPAVAASPCPVLRFWQF